MSTNYPLSLDNSTSLPYPSAQDDTNSPSLAGGQDNQNDALIAVQTLLGNNTTQTTPTDQYNVLQAGSATSNVWGKITSNNVSSSTGSGGFVLATSPTISSPTISSPTISSPTITGSLGNISTGTITASGATTLNSTLSVSGTSTLTGAVTANGGLTVSSSFTATGLVTFADLLSTIFSGQVTSYTNSGSGGGTGYYINLGGIKILWWESATSTQGGAGQYGPYYLDFPSSFFSSVTFALPGVTVDAGGAYAFFPGNPSTTSVGVDVITTVASTFNMWGLFIGT